MPLVSAILSLALATAAYTPKTDFSVIITVFRGERPLWTYRLTGESITVKRHYTDGRPEATALKRDLTVKEIKRLDRYFAGFPLTGLERHYVDERVDGDSCLRYIVRINRDERESYVCYARPGGLAGLNRAINRLLPRQYRLWVEE
jgi:hypothetical protein